MFHNISTLLTVSLLALGVTATAIPRGDAPPSGGQCNTEDIQCCNSVQNSDSPVASILFALLGINAGTVTGQVGVTCSPLSAVGIGGNSCSAQPVCCSNNNFNGVVAIGCTPININL